MARWPFVMLGIGGVEALVWGWTRRPRVITVRSVRMVDVDEEGNVLRVRRPRRVRREPERVRIVGLAGAEGPVRRRLASKRRRATLSFLPASPWGFDLRKWDGAVSLHIMFRPVGGERELRARAFFAARGLRPVKDYVASGGRIPHSPRLIGWPVPADDAVAICRDVLRELSGVGEDEGFGATYEAHR